MGDWATVLDEAYAYRVWCPDIGDTEQDATLIEAGDAVQAAESFVEDGDVDDPMGDGQSQEVMVRKPSGDVVRVRVVVCLSKSYEGEEQ